MSSAEQLNTSVRSVYRMLSDGLPYYDIPGGPKIKDEDSGLWDDLAKAKGIRLPLWSKVPTPRFLKRWHESLDTEPFEAVYGCSPSRLIQLNQHTPLRAFVGMMLERTNAVRRICKRGS